MSMKELLSITALILLISCNANQNPNVVNRENADKEETKVTEDEAIRSQMNRNRGSDTVIQATIMDEVKSTKKAYYPEGYSEVPSSTTTESYAEKIDISKYTTECGVLKETTSTVGERIADCRKKYTNTMGIPSSWVAKNFGVSGEGNWSLVSVAIDATQTPEVTTLVWYDFTTRLLWSDHIKEATFEEAVSDFNGVCKTFNKDNVHFLNTSYIDWRLPTRSEFLQADINGSRYILNNLDKTYWTSTLLTREAVYSIKQSTGNSSSTALTETHSVRCVGVAFQ